MPLQKLEFRPGLNREGTDYANEGGWYDGDKIRFRSGFPEKLGGWTRLSNSSYLGVARSLWNWIDFDGSNYLGIGTNIKYYIEQGGDYYDVTPFSKIESLPNSVTAVNGLSTLTITDVTYAPNVGDYIVISGAVTLGGNITATVLNQEYVITSINAGASTYTLEAKDATTGLPVLANASDTGHGGALLVVSYEVPIGLVIYVPSTGWSSGSWSRGTWGSSFKSALGQLRLWSNDNYGQDLVIAPRGLGIYYWKDSTLVTTRATALSTLANQTTFLTDAATFAGAATSITVSATAANDIYPYMYITGTNLPTNTQVASTYSLGSTTVPITTTTSGASAGNYNFSYAGAYVPTATNQILVASTQRILIAMGANSYDEADPNSEFNPMLVRWSDRENPYQWIPNATTEAGEFPLSVGSYIMGGTEARQEILIWTDAALYSMQYTGAPDIYVPTLMMSNISIISPKSMITINGVTYWMGKDKFYTYTGTVATLPCSIRQYIFADINLDQGFQVFAGGNEGYNEVWWFYVSSQSADLSVDKYVIYNYVDRVWYYGTMARTAWLDSGIRQYPMAADYNNHMLYHEFGVDDNSGTSPVAIEAYVQSSDFDIGDGHNFGFVWRILPDVNFNGSNINNPSVAMTIKPRQNSGTPYGAADSPVVTSANNFSTRGTYNIQEFTGQVYTRLRGRQMSFRIESTGLGVAWQLGMPRIDIRPDGRR